MKSVTENNTEIVASTLPAENSFAWNDVTVYNEMTEPTSQSTNLLQQIKNQMQQLEEMSARRQFLTKELMNYFNK